MSGKAIVESFNNKNILLIGDIMLDRYIYGRVERISPEAPVPIHLKEGESCDIGGAGTVLRNLADLGANVKFISVVGDDMYGREIIKLVGMVKNTEAYVFTEQSRPTTVKTRFVCGHHQMARADEETSRIISDHTRHKLIECAKRIIPGCDAVIISDYAKGVVTGRKSDSQNQWGAWNIIEIAKDIGVPVIVDPKTDDFSLYRGATVVTPNIPELNKASRLECMTTEEIILAAVDLIQKCEILNIIVTRSKDGMTIVQGDGEVHNIPSQAKDVFDVTGAGDTAVAVLSLALASGLSLRDAAIISNAAAGIAVGKLGTATVKPDELMGVL